VNAELKFDPFLDLRLPGEGNGRARRFLRFAVGLSLGLHLLAFLTSPWWQPGNAPLEPFLEVDIASVPDRELPHIPQAAPLRAPAPVPPPPPLPSDTVGLPSSEPSSSPDAGAPPPPTREMIREKIADRGILKMLGRGGGPGEDSLSGIKVPGDVKMASRGTPSSRAGDFAPGAGGGDPLAARGKGPGIDRQVAMASRSTGGGLSAQTFKTDAGLEAEISGAIDDRTRSASSIAATVRQYQSGIKFVYNKELQNRPDLSGKITVSFVIQPDGSVSAVEVRQSTVGWPPLEEAVKKRIQYWKFGAAAAGGPVRATFPFVFHPEM
jgi:TonB family protein